MKKLWLPIVGITSLCLLFVTPASAQKVSLGVKGGLNIADLAGDDVSSLESVTRVVGGGFAVVQFHDNFAFMPELLYAQRGAQDPADTRVLTIKLDYIEVPLLFRISPSSEAMKFLPYAMLGPSLAFKAACEVEAEEDGVVETADCGQIANFNSFDYGLTAGAGADFILGRMALVVDGRYTFGLGDVNDSRDVHNRVFALMLGLRMNTGPGPLTLTR